MRAQKHYRGVSKVKVLEPRGLCFKAVTDNQILKSIIAFSDDSVWSLTAA